MNIALVTDIISQDGAYLAQLPVDKGYTVYGTYCCTSPVNFWRIEDLGIQNHPNLTTLLFLQNYQNQCQPDNKLAGVIFDWEPKIKLEEGLAKTIDCFRRFLGS
jgi:GDP-D-mannose dehydratase